MTNLEGITLSNRYFLRQMVASGGVADVYLAWDKLRSTKMAIKVLRESSSESASMFELANREADVLRKLEHPFIVRLYDFVREGKHTFFVMDWIDGTNLRHKISTHHGPLSLVEISQILKPVCSALHYAHQNRVYHCDIKPANILIHVDGRVLLTDFGVARIAREAQRGGTPLYMAPEQFLGHEVNARTDVYGLGITIYEALSGGQLPFRGESPNSEGTTNREKIQWEHCNMPLPPLWTFNSVIPHAVVEVVEKALSKDPQERFHSTLELSEAFERSRAYVPANDNSLYHTSHLPQPPPPRPVKQAPPQPAKYSKEYHSVKGPHLLGQSGEWNSRVVPVPKGEVAIGRSRDSVLRLREPSVSRRHATIIRTRKSVYIRDENSLMGTFVNGERISGPVALKHGDFIQLGYYQQFQFREK